MMWPITRSSGFPTHTARCRKCRETSAITHCNRQNSWRRGPNHDLMLNSSLHCLLRKVCRGDESRKPCLSAPSCSPSLAMRLAKPFVGPFPPAVSTRLLGPACPLSAWRCGRSSAPPLLPFLTAQKGSHHLEIPDYGPGFDQYIPHLEISGEIAHQSYASDSRTSHAVSLISGSRRRRSICDTSELLQKP